MSAIKINDDAHIFIKSKMKNMPLTWLIKSIKVPDINTKFKKILNSLILK